MTGELNRETDVWRMLAVGSVLLAAWLSGMVLQATWRVLPTGGGEGSRPGSCPCQRRLDQMDGTLQMTVRGLEELRTEFERHLRGRGVGATATAKP